MTHKDHLVDTAGSHARTVSQYPAGVVKSGYLLQILPDRSLRTLLPRNGGS
jgi:hypothetical protein